MNEFLDAALLYAARGWPVFPCKPRSKHPITEHGFKDATSDIAQVEQWWWSTPRANVAVPTGVMFDVVDFDHVDVYDQARDVHGLHGPQVATARGAHLHVVVTGRRCTKLTASIDFKALGGYVLLPPSVHPSGVRYEWIARGEPQPVPLWLRELLQERSAGTAGASRARDRLKSNLTPGLTRRSVASLRAMADRLAHQTEGNRNQFLYWCALRASDTGIAQADVAIVLGEAAERAGLDDREITRTLDSAFTRWT